MVACYCRVSSRRQTHESQKAESQRWVRQNRIRARRVVWFADTETGRSLKRPAFDRLPQEIFAGKVERVVVWKLDRLARRQRDGINLLAEWCDRGVRIVVVTQQIDLSGTVGRLVARVLFGLAAIEQEFRRERHAAGIAVAKRNGIYRGRKRGTTKAKPARARTLRSRGLTTPEIANALNISPRTVFRYLAQRGR
jgi:DNA invertase Pin-like site-specific DNA recombinase